MIYADLIRESSPRQALRFAQFANSFSQSCQNFRKAFLLELIDSRLFVFIGPHQLLDVELSLTHSN